MSILHQLIDQLYSLTQNGHLVEEYAVDFLELASTVYLCSFSMEVLVKQLHWRVLWDVHGWTLKQYILCPVS